MAWLFSLSAECGLKTQAEEFAAYFKDKVWKLGDGTTIASRVTLQEDGESNWWAMIAPRGLSESGIRNAEDARQMSELSDLVYNDLREAPNFRFALVGVEVDLFRTYLELLEDEVIRQDPADFPGLVLAEAVWELLDRPAAFQPFKPGYVWLP